MTETSEEQRQTQRALEAAYNASSDVPRHLAFDSLQMTTLRQSFSTAEEAEETLGTLSDLMLRRLYETALNELKDADFDDLDGDDEGPFSSVDEFRPIPEHVFSETLWELISLGDEGYEVSNFELKTERYQLIVITSSNPMGAVFRNDEDKPCLYYYDGTMDVPKPDGRLGAALGVLLCGEECGKTVGDYRREGFDSWGSEELQPRPDDDHVLTKAAASSS